VDVVYATGSVSGIYHLVVRNDQETLCGLRVSRLRSEQSLHLVDAISGGHIICKHCERIRKNAKSDQA